MSNNSLLYNTLLWRGQIIADNDLWNLWIVRWELQIVAETVYIT